jgi:hypothetical protein
MQADGRRSSREPISSSALPPTLQWGGPLRRATAVASRDRNQAFFAHEVAAWTRGRRSINEVGIELLHQWFPPQGSVPPAITDSEVLGVVPLEVTDALLDEFHRLADRHERGVLAEQVVELLTTS